MKDLVEKFSHLSDKEEKIYQSVMLLLQVGRDISTLTVSEITEKAGIGKGTAYGYFKSKEEMLQADYPREYQEYMIMSSIGAFWMFLNQEKHLEEENRERFKAYLYRCLVSNLNMKK